MMPRWAPNPTMRRVMIHHHDQNPVCCQGGRFAPKQVAAPQAVLRVAEEGEPGWTSGISVRPVMNAQDTTDNIPVHVNAESQGDLLGNAGTTPGTITLFHGMKRTQHSAWAFNVGLRAGHSNAPCCDP